MRKMTETTTSQNLALVRRYFDIVDGRIEGDVRELFEPNVQLFFPKSGIVLGADVVEEVRSASTQSFRCFFHHVDEFTIIEHGETVVVEGTHEGETVSGQRWDGRKTIAGRFCSVFEIRQGRIARMHVYLDPDFGI